ncbi:MAG: hypothetical protein K6G56_02700 [Clostridiales bacterium]|nr:hypothetical protein [Clostridiales bacterium]
MKGEDLLRKMSDIEDSDIILSETSCKRRPRYAAWLYAAAALLVGLGVFAAVRLINKPEDEHHAYVPTAAPTEPVTEFPTDVPTAAPTETEPLSTQATPPEMLFFTGVKEYREFAEAAKLGEEEFESFLDEHGTYYMNGICSKQDAVNALKTLNSIPTPLLAGYELWRIELSSYNDRVRLIYRSGAHYISFVFTISCSDEDAESVIRGTEHELTEIDTGDIGELRYLLRVMTEEGTSPNAYYYSNIHAHKTFLITDIGEEELLALLRGCRFITVEEYSESADR